MKAIPHLCFLQSEVCYALCANWAQEPDTRNNILRKNRSNFFFSKFYGKKKKLNKKSNIETERNSHWGQKICSSTPQSTGKHLNLRPHQLTRYLHKHDKTVLAGQR